MHANECCPQIHPHAMKKNQCLMQNQIEKQKEIRKLNWSGKAGKIPCV